MKLNTDRFLEATMKLSNSFLAAVFAISVVATASSSAVALQVPDYRIVKTQDMSFGAVRRFNVRVRLPQHYQRDQIEQIAKAVVADLTKRERVNAISIMFYGPGGTVTGAWDVGVVDWAPNGRWGDAMTVRAGDYSSFQYKVTYRPPPPPADTVTSLKPSGRRGLLGAPLPEGATLAKRSPGDPAVGRHPSEQYRLSASAKEIAAYFNREMPKARWLKDGLSTDYALFFNKGNAQLDVLINGRGGSFTLAGS